MSRNYIIGISVVFVLIVIGLIVYGGKLTGPGVAFPSTSNATSTANSSTTPVSVGNVQIELQDKDGNITTQTVPASLPKPVPNFNRAVTIPADLGAEATAVLKERFASARENLTKDVGNYNNWIDLGDLYKIARDYEGSREAWTYAARLNPQALVSHANLADLYQSYLKKYSDAEAEWNAVLSLDPKYTQGYLGLASLYQNFYPGKESLVAGVYMKGLTKDVHNIDLMINLAAYYKGKKDTVNARKYYQNALGEAQLRKDTRLEALLQEELNNLPK